jgi:hypothetical protein
LRTPLQSRLVLRLKRYDYAAPNDDKRRLHHDHKTRGHTLIQLRQMIRTKPPATVRPRATLLRPERTKVRLTSGTAVADGK